jgi:hypothetical protein
MHSEGNECAREFPQRRLCAASVNQLPAVATASIEVDILATAGTDEETEALADAIEGVADELSRFEDLYGFSIDGVLSPGALRN